MIGTIELYKAIRERLEIFFPEVNVQQKDIKTVIGIHIEIIQLDLFFKVIT